MTIVAVITVVTLGAVILSVVSHTHGMADAVGIIETGGTQDPVSDYSQEIVEITNGITREFHSEDRSRSHIGPCIHRTLERVNNMTNDTLRLAVAWHLAGEVLQLNLTNENYHLRWNCIDDAVDSIRYADSCLQVAGAPEMERCKFFFDALQRVKDGFLVTLAESPTRPTEMDRYGRGAEWAQMNCKRRVSRYFASIPGSLCNGEFRLMYPRLLPETQEYFRKRFREVFGIAYMPYESKTKAHIFGENGTVWDGKGLKWRVCDENNNWHDVVTEE